MSHWVSRSFFRLLLRLYPRPFRDSYSEELERAFLESLKIQRGRFGWLGTPYTLLRSLGDTIATSLEQRRALYRRKHLCDQNLFVGRRAMISSITQDVRFSLRALLKNPGFTIVAVLTLALGIGANTAVFSVVNTVLLQPLPYEDPEQLAVIWTNFGPDLPQNWVSGPELADMREFTTSFEDIGATVFATLSVTGDGEPEVVGAAGVSGNFFRVLRTNAVLGRTILPEDDSPEADRVVMISDGLWKSRYGNDPSVVGKTIFADGASFNIVGVLPPGFKLLHPDLQLPDNVGLWAPITPFLGGEYWQLPRGNHFLRAVGRLKPDVSLEQAKLDMSRVAIEMHEKSPEYYDRVEGWGITVYSLHGDLVESVRPALLVLLGGVAFVLLIACANVANLQLVRATGREREIAVRTALGAKRSRLTRQFLTESIVLSAVGGGFGLLCGFGLLKALVVLAPDALPRRGDIAIDGSVLLFTLSVALLTGVLFGLAPIVHGIKESLVDSLKEGGHGAGTGSQRGRLRDGLVVAEIALAMVLLIGAGLMIRSFMRLQAADPGFNPENLLTMSVALPGAKYRTPEDQHQFFDRLIENTEALPGVTSVGAISHLPLSGSYTSGTTWVNSSETVPEEGRAFEAERRWASPDYFRAMGIDLIRGRFFTDLDVANGQWVAIVDEEFVRRFWPTENPIGKQISIHRDDQGERVWREVVGVVRHSRHYNVGSAGREQAFYPYRQGSSNELYLAIRTEMDPTQVVGAVRDEVWALDPDQPIAEVRTMDELVAASVSQPRFNLLLIGSFAGIALLLATVGIYGVISYSVSQRNHEIGVRMALGAAGQDVLGLVLRQGLSIAGIGLVIGILGAVWLTRLLTNMLYGVGSVDLATYAGVVVLLGVVAAAACAVPALRASRVHPVEVLRQD
jgi:putative ABC transport system permease protein